MGFKKYEVYKFGNEKILIGTECFNDILVEVVFSGYLTQELDVNGTLWEVQFGLPCKNSDDYKVEINKVQIDNKNIPKEIYSDFESDLIECFMRSVYGVEDGKIKIIENTDVTDAINTIYYCLKDRL